MIRKIVLVIFAVLIAASLVSCNASSSSGETPAAVTVEASTPAPTPAESQSAQAVMAEAADTAAPSAAPSPEPEPAPVNTPGPGKAVIIFTFDDGPLSDYLLAYPILKEYGIKGTSYIITKFVNAGTVGKMTWEQIKEMGEYGWAFGGHTYEHQHMTGLSDEELKQDCENVSWSFINQGLTPPEIMAYPYGSYNKRVIEAIKPYYKQARLAFYRTDFVDTGDPNPYAIECISADMRTEGKLKKVERLVDKACDKGAIIVFRVHTLYKEKPYDTVKYNKRIASGCAPQTSSKLFGELVKYCVDKGCAFMTMPELMDYMEAQKAGE